MLMTGESLSKAEAKLMNPVVLAFVGDAVYSLYVRNRMAVCYKGKPADFSVRQAKSFPHTAKVRLWSKFLLCSPKKKRRFFCGVGTRKKARKAKMRTLRNTTVLRGLKRYSAFYT